MQKTYSILSSRLFWTVALIALYNTLTAIGTFTAAPWVTTIIDLIGLVLSTYFHVNPSQKYNTDSIQ